MQSSHYNKLEKRVRDIERKCCCNNSIEEGCCYNEVTYAEAQDLVASDSLIKGSLYKITDRGDLGIYLVAVENNKFEEEGVRNMLIPNVDLIEGSTYWYPSQVIYNTGSNTVFEGFVYESLVDGNLETPSNDQVNWQLIPKSIDNDEYVSKTFGVLYDFEDDWINLQWDEYDNKVGHSKHIVPSIYSENLVDITDWWLFEYINSYSEVDSGYDYVYNNRAHGIYGNILKHDGGPGILHDNECFNGTIVGNSAPSGSLHLGFYGNSVLNGINNNTSITSIINNHCDLISGNSYNVSIYNNKGRVNSIQGNIVTPGDGNGSIDISNNANTGDISGNLVSPSSAGNSILNIQYNNNIGSITSNVLETPDVNAFIWYNNNNGTIDSNTDFTEISYNSNAGSIFSNSCSTITQNANNGDILSNSGAFDIFNNINNGDIGPNVMVADISDTIVNK